MKPDGLSDGNSPGPAGGTFREVFHSWRYFFWLLALGLLVLVFYAEEDWRGKWMWERYKHQMEARGERMNAAAFVPPEVPDDKNFAETRFLAPLFEFSRPTPLNFSPGYDAASRLVPSVKGERTNSWVGPRMDLRVWSRAFAYGTNRPARQATESPATNGTIPEAAEGVLSGLSDTAPVIDELRLASQRPFARFNLHYQEDNPSAMLLPHLGTLRHLTQILQLRAAAELALGQTDAAFDDVQLMLYLTSVCQDEPILISQLVRMAQLNMALQAIAEGMDRWSEPQLRFYAETLSRLDFCADAERTLEAERSLFGMGIIDFLRRASSASRPGVLSGMFSGPSGGPGPEAILMSVVPSGWFYLEEVNYCRTYDDYVLPTIDAPNRRVNPAANHKADNRVEALTRSSGLTLFLRHRIMSALLLPSISKTVRKAALAQAGAEAGALACALELCRRAHGQFPESLGALTPQFIKKLPHDVINGEPLKYWREGDGQYMLYSVGWNEKDDGGIVVAPGHDGQTTEITSGDWVWRPVAQER